MKPEDEQLGFDKVPDRYARSGRETIDLIRDSMTDEQFIAFCWGQVVCYRDRAGAKGPALMDQQKAQFYAAMALRRRGTISATTCWWTGYDEGEVLRWRINETAASPGRMRHGTPYAGAPASRPGA